MSDLTAIRLKALELAINTAVDDEQPESIVKRARAYAEFVESPVPASLHGTLQIGTEVGQQWPPMYPVAPMKVAAVDEPFSPEKLWPKCEPAAPLGNDLKPILSDD